MAGPPPAPPCVSPLSVGPSSLPVCAGLPACPPAQTLPAGAKIVCGDDLYGGTYRLFTQVFAKTGRSFTFEDLTNKAPEDAIPEGTTLVWVETPTNPLLKVIDFGSSCFMRDPHSSYVQVS